MQTKILVFLLLLFFSSVQLTAQGNMLAYSILKKTKEAIENIKTMRYGVDYNAYSDDKEGKIVENHEGFSLENLPNFQRK
jgi:hypothetical protein